MAAVTMASEPADQTPNEYSIRAVERVCDLLNLIGSAAEGVSAVDAAAAVGLPRSSAFRYLVTLEQRRYVERDAETGNYRLGTAILPLQVREVDRLIQRARPHLEQLRDDLGETANLARLDGTRVIYLDILESPQAMRLAARPGERDHLHSTALGKAVAAGLDEGEVRRIIDAEGLPRFTDRTITDAERLLQELRRVRRRGYAIDDGENEPGARCVAVTLPGRPTEAISVSAPAARLTQARAKEVAAKLAEAAAAISHS
jgi:IclR family transcriptional regulator, acetate operon repressor